MEKEKLQQELKEALEQQIDFANVAKLVKTEKNIIVYTAAQNAVIMAQNRLLLFQQQQLLDSLGII
jgi:hypothetical protein